MANNDTDFVGQQKAIAQNDDCIFNMLSDLSHLEKIKDRIPQDKIKEFSFDTDSCTINADPVGKVTFRIIEREPNSTIKLVSENSPVPVTLWIQLKQVAEKDTRLRVTLRAEINSFLKPMVSKPLQQFVDRFTDVLATLPYNA